MYGPTILATFDRGKGPIELELGVIKDEKATAALFTSWINDGRVRKYLTLRPQTQTSEEEFIRGLCSNNGRVYWAIYADSRLVGGLEVFEISRDDRNGEIGILIGDKSTWGMGIASAAEALVAEYAFENIVAGGLNKIIVRVLEGNETSRGALENIGFREVGVWRKHHWARGGWHDIWLGELLQEDWRQNREQAFKAAGITSYNIYPGSDE